MKSDPPRESVWNYPRPPRLEPSSRLIRVEFAGVLIAQTTRAYRVLETSHPPGWYLPPEDVHREYLLAASGQSLCEWKGLAQYWTVSVDGMHADKAAWSYPHPTPAFSPIANYLAFYPNRVECSVDGQRVQPQAGGFYGGWITPELDGPFKGPKGTSGW